MRVHPEVGGRVRAIQSLPVLLMASLVGCDATKADIEAGPPILGDTGITLDGDGDGDGDSDGSRGSTRARRVPGTRGRAEPRR